MRTHAVVVVDPAVNAGPCFAAGLESMQVDAFIFDRPPEPLDHDVVHPASLAIHGNAGAGLLEHGGECIAGKLAALIGIEDLRTAIALQGLFQGRNAEIGIQGVGQPSGQGLAPGPAHDCHQARFVNQSKARGLAENGQALVANG